MVEREAAVRSVLRIAAGEIGNTERPSNSNRTKYGAWYGLDGNPWCMMFVQWCFAQAGTPLPHRTASCSDMLSWYRKHRPERVSAVPKPGDIVIYTFGHTGIVESAGANTVTAIEGNTSAGEAGSQSNGGGVFRRTRSKALAAAYISAFDGLDKDPAADASGGQELNGADAQFTEDGMTGKEIFDALNDYLKKQPVPGWAESELKEAVRLGITDGKEPMALIPRYQAAIMAKRAREQA